MGRFVKGTAKDLNVRDVFIYKGKSGYVIGKYGVGDEDRYYPIAGFTYSDGTGEYKALDLLENEEVEILRFDPEYHQWRKAMLKNTGLEHLTS